MRILGILSSKSPDSALNLRWHSVLGGKPVATGYNIESPFCSPRIDCPVKASSRKRLPHFFLGSTTWILLRVLCRYGGFAPAKLLKVLGLLCFSILDLPFRAWEALRFNRRIRKTELHPQPIFIIGYWQSGTSPLHFHLCLDPRFGYLDTLQAVFPWTFLTGGWIVRRAMNRIIKNKDRGSDSYRLHESLPQGADLAMAKWSDLSIYHAYVFPQAAEEVFRRTVLMEDLSQAEIDRWKSQYRFLMQKIAFATGKSQIVMRNACDSGHIKLLLEMFPEAKFVRMIRDPYQTCQASDDRWESMCRIWSLQRFDIERLRHLTVDFYELMMEKFDREKDLIPEGQLATVRYEELMDAPVATMQQLYRDLKLTGFETVRPLIEEYTQQQSGSLAGEQADAMPREWREKISSRLESVFQETGYALEAGPHATTDVLEKT